MEVYFMRHGESEYNPERIINSDKKIKVRLTTRGKEQAEEAGRKLGKLKFDAIFVSGFIRAKETAEIVNKYLKVPVRTDSKLNEINLGMEGRPADEFWKAAREFGNIVRFKLKGKESFFDVKKKVEKFLRSLKKKKYERVLVVTHEANVMSARAIFDELDDEDSFTTPVKNCEIFRFEI
jgi:broad specificity phosphatase PhoE